MQRGKLMFSAVLAAAVSLVIGGNALAATETDVVNITATVNGAPTPANTMYVYFNDASSPLGSPSLPVISGLDAYAGLINWDNVGGTDSTSSPNLLSQMPLSYFSGAFSTYCIDIEEEIDINHTYSFTGLTTDLASTPVIASNSFNMGTTAATNIQNLYDDEYATVTADNTGEESAAFQVAIWDIIYGINSNTSSIDVTNTGNRFYISGAPGGVATLADSFVEAAYAGDNSKKAPLTLLALTDAGVQDQLVVGQASSDIPSVPTPTAAIAGVSLLAGLGIWKSAKKVR